jgi:hypothetical protein
LIRILHQREKFMDTLELRIERLERSCRRWRMGFLMLVLAGVACAATSPSTMPGPLADARFGHLTVQSLTIRSQADGAFLLASCDVDHALIRLASPGASTLVNIEAKKESAVMGVSRVTDRGLASAAMGADGQSGFVDLRTADGKNEEVEPR